MTRVSSNNKEKEAKRKNSVKKRDQTGKKKRYKETENSVAGVEPGLPARASNFLTIATVTDMI